MYRAPEMINLYMRDQLTVKTDIWALGCIFYSICFLKHPFQDQGSLAIQQAKYVIPKDMTIDNDGIEFLHRMIDVRQFSTECDCLFFLFMFLL
jgi:serine/threonine protein kinase